MDSKKSESIKTIWEKVNQEFGSIFGTLLPGSNAKLEPPEGCSYLDGNTQFHSFDDFAFLLRSGSQSCSWRNLETVLIGTQWWTKISFSFVFNPCDSLIQTSSFLPPR